MQTRKQSLSEYRSRNAKLAIYRDDGMCVICWFRYNRKRLSTQVHHIYGRSRQPDWREHYTSLMGVCNECHPKPIIHKPASESMVWIEEIAEKMNDTPINKDFEHDKT